MNVYSIDISIAGTAYIKAESEDQAFEIAQTLAGEWLEFSNGHQAIGDDICMDGCQYRGLYDNDETTALSPAMTIVQSQDFSISDLELVEEDIDVEEGEDA